MPAILSDAAAPIITMVDRERTLQLDRWVMRSPQFGLKGRMTDAGVTNVRNAKSPHWRRWLGLAHRCLVRFPSFSQHDAVDGRKVPV